MEIRDNKSATTNRNNEPRQIHNNINPLQHQSSATSILCNLYNELANVIPLLFSLQKGEEFSFHDKSSLKSARFIIKSTNGKMLELRSTCERCSKSLPPESEHAMICTFECTFCSECVENELKRICPNCGGNFEKRPIRPAHLLEKYPPISAPQ